MQPGNFALTVYRGDTYRWRFVLWQDADNQHAVDLTGVVPKAEIRDAPCGELVTELAVEIELPNVIHMHLDEAHSIMLRCPRPREPWWSGVWDLTLRWANGDRSTVLGGAVEVTPNITDSRIEESDSDEDDNGNDTGNIEQAFANVSRRLRRVA